MPQDLAAPPPDARLAALEAELAGLRDELALANLRAEVQALRASAQGGAVHQLRHQMALMQGSTIWRATLPLRLAIDIARGIPEDASAEARLLRRFLGMARREGLRAAIAAARAWRRRRGAGNALTAHVAGGAAAMPPPAASLLAPKVVIIAELSIPQCAKYRVWQKQEMFAALGVPAVVLDWHDAGACHGAIATATIVILYRVPASPHVLALIEAVKALNIQLHWEVDDLIFDREAYLANTNLQTVSKALVESVLSGIEPYRAAMLAAGAGIASTPQLADAMRKAGLARVDVVENALDAQSLRVAEQAIAARRARTDAVVIAYGSGTNTHDADFRVCAGALLALLGRHAHLRLRIIGTLELDPGFAAFGDRVERLPPMPFARYAAALAEADISIAPLEASAFNDAKSNIKFLEASMLGLASVCSRAANFAAVVRHGETGFLAGDAGEWEAALERLILEPQLRRRMAAAARADVLARYAPAAIAERQLRALLPAERPQKPKLRVLMANVFWAPRSYGGATLVAEEMAARLQAMADTDVHVVTSLAPDAGVFALRRESRAGAQVFSLPIVAGDAVAEFDDPITGAVFGDVLDALQPDVVHLHSIQTLSASLAAACRARGIPYVITLHDSWWLCARQFMVRADGKYCHQTRIDLRSCQSCMPEARHLQARAALLRAALEHAACLLSPSEAHRQLYLANGVAPERIITAPNGVRLPAPGFARSTAPYLRFAYVGGVEAVKGFGLLRRAFEAQTSGAWQLTLVDNTQALGFSTMEVSDWQVQGRLRVVPAYRPEELDAFFADVDVLVFPSQWKESFGLTVREALARHVWVITTAGGGPAEAVREGVNGNLIALDGDHAQLAAAISALLENPGKLAGWRNGLAETIIDFDAQARHLHGVLAQIAAEHREGPAIA